MMEARPARAGAYTFGLNPYGTAYHLGLHGAGGPRANPKGAGLEGFLALGQELGARAIEIFDPWLRALSDRDLAALKERLAALDMVPIVSWGLMMGPFESALRSARALDAKTIRCGLTTVLCGDRARLGEGWTELVGKVGQALAEYGPQVAADGRMLAIENHQDFGSDELVAFCESSEGVGICVDAGNTFPVAEAPLDFYARVAPHVRHVHLKDYRVQFTDEGYRLVRCAIGDGAVPVAEMLELFSAHHPTLTAVLEPGALEARHVRFLKPEWWALYPPKTAASLAACLRAPRSATVCPTTPTRERPGKRARTAQSRLMNSR